MRSTETPLTFKAKQAFAVYKDGLGRQIIDGLVSEVERLTAEIMIVRTIIAPNPPPGVDFTNELKARLYDELRSKLYPT